MRLAAIARSLSILLAAASMLLAGTAAHAQVGSVELAIKATYLYKFAPYVDWPAGMQQRAYMVCIVGDDPFGGVLDQAVAGQSVNGRPIAVRRMMAASRDSGCDVMFIAGSAQQSVAEALAVTSGTPVLTVTDARIDGPHGIINFVIAENRVRFEIDAEAASHNGLAISSKLLSLAVRPPGNG